MVISRGDELKDYILLVRNLLWHYQLEDFTDSTLQEISRTIRIAEDDLLYSLKAKDIRMLEEIQDLMFGVQAVISGDIEKAVEISGISAYEEHQRILNFDGKLKDTVGFNDIAITGAQLRNYAVGVPVGGEILESWMNRTFGAGIIQQYKEQYGAGLLLGESIPKLIERIPEDMRTIEREMITLTRTYVADINNKAMLDVYKANKDIIKEEQWNATLELSTLGYGTCIRCASMMGKSFPITEVHNRPPLHPRCVTAESIIFAPDITHFMQSRYSGPIIKISLSNGTDLSVTPNHMLMTPNGLVMARFLAKSDYLLGSKHFKGVVFGNPNDNRNELRIDNVIKSFSESFSVPSASMPMSSEYFHGDGVFGDKYVNIINANSFLINNINTKFFNKISSYFFSSVDLASLLSSYSNITLFFKRYLSSSHNNIGLSREFFSFVCRCISHPDKHSFASISGLDTIVFQKPLYSGPANIKFFSDGFNRNSVVEETDSFIKVKLSVIAAFIFKNREAIPNKSVFNRFSLNTNHIPYFIHREARPVKFMKKGDINFMVGITSVKNRLFAKVSYFYFILSKNVFNCCRVGIKFFSDIYQFFPIIVKVNNFINKRVHSILSFFSKIKTVINKHFAKFCPINSGLFSDCSNAFAAGIEAIKIINIDIEHVEFLPVYDVSTMSSMYIVNGILSSNCRCLMLPVTKSYKELGLNIPELEETAQAYSIRKPYNIDAGRWNTILEAGQFKGSFEEFLQAKPDKYAESLLGPNRFRLWKSGKVKLEDMTDDHGDLRLLKKNEKGNYVGLQK